MRILVLGSDGQMGRCLRYVGLEATYLGRNDIDLGCPAAVNKVLDVQKPNLIINCAAFTDVNGAETKKILAWRINVRLVRILRDWARVNDSAIIHFSTDYVFDGTKAHPYVETDTPDPLNFYGLTKSVSEQLFNTEDRCWIFRTQWLFSPWGKNFVRKIYSHLLAGQRRFQIVSNQVGCPTPAIGLARAIMMLIKTHTISDFRILHAGGTRPTSWWELARMVQEEIPAGEEVNIVPCSSDQLTGARRPQDSRLDSTAFEFLTGKQFLNFNDGLKETLRLLNEERA